MTDLGLTESLGDGGDELWRGSPAVIQRSTKRGTASVKTGYSPVDGTKPSVKDRFRMGRSGTPDPYAQVATMCRWSDADDDSQGKARVVTG